MGYCGLMGFGTKFPAHQVGGSKKVWVFRVYGLSKAWVLGGSTVHLRGAGNKPYKLRDHVFNKIESVLKALVYDILISGTLPYIKALVLAMGQRSIKDWEPETWTLSAPRAQRSHASRH